MMLNNNRKSFLSAVTCFLIVISICYARFQYPRWNSHDGLAVLSWDAMGYYLYLPSAFIYHDFSQLNYKDIILKEYNPTIGFYQAYKNPYNGKYVMKYPMGVAILMSPFFFIGHWMAGITGYVQDGFSAPYQLWIAIGSLYYMALGLYVLRKILLKFFSDVVCSILLMAIALGTNYFNQAAYCSAMCHVYLFTLFALILYFTIEWYNNQKLFYALMIAFLIGLAALVRPTEVLISIVPFLWGVCSTKELKERFKFFLKIKAQLFFAFIIFLITISPQLIYWKIETGKFFYFSYESNEGFQFFKPFIFQVLFSFKKGWLIYTPIMIVVIAGFRNLYKSNKQIFFPVFIFFLLNLWIVSSWKTWWYGGSFSQRSFVQSYVLMTFPLGYLIHDVILKRRAGIIVLFFSLIVSLMSLNLFQDWQYMHWIISTDKMTKEYYKRVFLKTNVSPDDLKYLEQDLITSEIKNIDESKFNVKKLFEEKFDSNYKGAVTENYFSSPASFKLSKDVQFSPSYSKTFKESGIETNSVIRATSYINNKNSLSAGIVISVERDGKSIVYIFSKPDTATCKTGEWRKVQATIQLPATIEESDVIKVYVYLPDDNIAFADDILIEALEPK